ncbi:reverse transcriptase domain-containing protein [Sphingobacterium siyangense]|uniref:Reverse transcriptase (RNA-dependent DNA polymerase) n=1 Tax=Sphingobacterium siyangense TaxID=459529 RepID=A0A562N112_9SPHI|nr:reverse transcriptase domain-containing protein [Sphingobacterium siyangense]TWI25869.1 reverse transcriptase (RNA-dependent DNA polymerase) [Sphingobacterium siyangense]
MSKKEEIDWFKLKRYPHIGYPLGLRDRKWVTNYVKTKTAQHSFLPFIHRTSKVRKFRKKYNNETGIVENEKKRVPSIKLRELYYASHLDSLIYSYHTKELSDKYETFILGSDLAKSVIAYRRIKKPGLKSHKSTIDFAKEVFDYIQNYSLDNLVVMTFDVSSFFDNLNHNLLLKEWVKVAGGSKLDDSSFNIFKSLTRFTYVELVQLFESYKEKIIVEKFDKDGNSLGRRKKKISAIKFLKNQNAISFCEKEEFLKTSKRLVKRKLYQTDNTGEFLFDENGSKIKRDYGIPQGTPMSALLSNIYMIPFDEAVLNLLDGKSLYRRYCDDIIVVCSKIEYVKIKDSIYELIKERKLEIQPQKTQVFHLKRKGEGFQCGQEFPDGINWNKKLTYLGFEFDGKKVLLKSASVSGYYRKMKRGVRRGKYFSSKIYGGEKQPLFKRRIYKRYSYLGAKRCRVYLPDKSNPKKFYKSERYNWGNFLSYAYKAESIFKTGAIKRQIQRHWNILHKLLS